MIHKNVGIICYWETGSAFKTTLISISLPSRFGVVSSDLPLGRDLVFKRRMYCIFREKFRKKIGKQSTDKLV